jgi:hypothetical protein
MARLSRNPFPRLPATPGPWASVIAGAVLCLAGCAQPEHHRAAVVPPLESPRVSPAPDAPVPPVDATRIALSGTGAAAVTDGGTASAPSIPTLPPPRLTLDQLYEAQRASVALLPGRTTALRNVSALSPAQPFDRNAWVEDPDAYLSVIEPGRIYQTETEHRMHQTRIQGATQRTVSQGATEDIVFVTAPHAPLTVFSNGLGAFPNGLTCISLRSDDQGVVRVRWTAIPGTVGDVMLVASSPMAVGQAHLFLEVE